MSIASGVLLLSDFGLWDGWNKRLGVWGEENGGDIPRLLHCAWGLWRFLSFVGMYLRIYRFNYH